MNLQHTTQLNNCIQMWINEVQENMEWGSLTI